MILFVIFSIHRLTFSITSSALSTTFRSRFSLCSISVFCRLSAPVSSLLRRKIVFSGQRDSSSCLVVVVQFQRPLTLFWKYVQRDHELHCRYKKYNHSPRSIRVAGVLNCMLWMEICIKKRKGMTSRSVSSLQNNPKMLIHIINIHSYTLTPLCNAFKYPSQKQNIDAVLVLSFVATFFKLISVWLHVLDVCFLVFCNDILILADLLLYCIQ